MSNFHLKFFQNENIGGRKQQKLSIMPWVDSGVYRRFKKKWQRIPEFLGKIMATVGVFQKTKGILGEALLAAYISCYSQFIILSEIQLYGSLLSPGSRYCEFIPEVDEEKKVEIRKSTVSIFSEIF